LPKYVVGDRRDGWFRAGEKSLRCLHVRLEVLALLLSSSSDALRGQAFFSRASFGLTCDGRPPDFVQILIVSSSETDSILSAGHAYPVQALAG